MQEDGRARLHVRRSKTDPEAEGAVLYNGPKAAKALVPIVPDGCATVKPVYVGVLAVGQTDRRSVNAAAKAAGQGDGFTDRRGRTGDDPEPGGRRGGAARADAGRLVEESSRLPAAPSARLPDAGPLLGITKLARHEKAVEDS